MSLKIQPQSFLQEAQMPMFNAIVEHLENYDAADPIDSYIISMTAYWLWLFQESATQVNEKGTIQVYESGAMNVSPHVTNLQKSQEKLEKNLDKLGMTPEGRNKLIDIFKPKPKEAKDPLAELAKNTSVA